MKIFPFLLTLLLCLVFFLVVSIAADNILEASKIARFVFGSCNNAQLSSGIWKSIAAKAPDRLILLGDNFYADYLTPAGYKAAALSDIKAQYQRLWNNSDWKSLIGSLGGIENVFATFDDHDFGHNDGDRLFRHRNESIKLFHSYFPNSKTDTAVQNIDGVYSAHRITLGEITFKFLMLDVRSNKDPYSYRNKGDFLGAQQWAWLEQELLSSYTDVVFVGSSIQVLPDDKIVEENWGAFRNARERLLRLILSANTDNIFILSGDVHHAEISQV
jgi:alkaline phosphatase D